MSLDSLAPTLPTIVLTIAVLIGGLWVFKRSSVKQLGEMQAQVIETYKEQNEAQEVKIKALERKVARLEGVISTLQITLKRRRGLLIEISDDLITLVDQRTGQEQSVKIHIDSGEIAAVNQKDKEQQS